VFASARHTVEYLFSSAGLCRLLDVPGHVPLPLDRDPAENLIRVCRPPHALARATNSLMLKWQAGEDFEYTPNADGRAEERGTAMND